LNSSAEVWTKNNNDMLQRARDAGYQTATINLYDANGASQDMWDNGNNHFGKKLIVIAHSKALIMDHNLQISPTAAGPDGWQISSAHRIPVPLLCKHPI